MQLHTSKRLSCGVVIVNSARELMLCHVTGQGHWDLPKGGIDSGESPIQAALRETREETGLQLDAQSLLDLGRFEYSSRKDLHLFATLTGRFDVSTLVCESLYRERMTGRRLPEMDGYGWFPFARVRALCTAKLVTVLESRIDLPTLVDTLLTPQSAALAA
jgi:8-oxo-dGTP pyrophosphatase MutT (NUDIX family)